MFKERGKPEYVEKTSQSKGENKQQTRPSVMYVSTSGSQTWTMLVGGKCPHHCAILASTWEEPWPSPHGQICILLVFYFHMWVGGASEYKIFTVHTITRLCSENKVIADSSKALTYKNKIAQPAHNVTEPWIKTSCTKMPYRTKQS